jgi:hypothetical protein
MAKYTPGDTSRVSPYAPRDKAEFENEEEKEARAGKSRRNLC